MKVRVPQELNSHSFVSGWWDSQGMKRRRILFPNRLGGSEVFVWQAHCFYIKRIASCEYNGLPLYDNITKYKLCNALVGNSKRGSLCIYKST